ncbi:hypothetical protein FSARC_8519 [Fusarium sarcochroum]|uniref:Rhodopsin domain-containing protein n=1 Tax=Fusarium sarcochroum TaxID=1208366 RepID=A0A8H4X6V9_9HYPO|nr:hypothetical protein FSARC_8519 [Fusarium sarcochroum]
MADAMEPWHSVKPSGLAAAILGVDIAFTALCLAVVSLRVWIRLTTRCFGHEDWLMCIGTLLNMVHNGIVIWGVFTGVGTRDSELNMAIMMEGAKSVALWQIFYVSGSVFIKSSICIQLLRIATNKRYKYFLWCLIAVSVIITLIAMLAVLVRCKPVAASWNPALGTCIDQNIIVVLTYVVSGMNIVTDWSVAIMPVFILRNIQMRKTLKRMAILVMGVGVLASVATIIRLPYSSAYSNPKDQLYGIGNIILWTVVECGLGIIAGSMPMLRKLFKTLSKDESSYVVGSNDINLATIGQIRGKHHPMYDGDMRATVVAGDDRDSGRDDESTRQMIRESFGMGLYFAYMTLTGFGSAPYSTNVTSLLDVSFFHQKGKALSAYGLVYIKLHQKMTLYFSNTEAKAGYWRLTVCIAKATALPVVIRASFQLAISTLVNFAPAQMGLMYIPIMIGSLVGVLLGGILNDWMLVRMAQRRDVLAAAGCLLYGAGVHLIILCIGLVLLGLYLNLCLPFAPGYALDSYLALKDEILQLSSFGHNAFGGALSFCVRPWISASGPRNTIIYLVVVIFIAHATSILLQAWGKGLRRGSVPLYHNLCGQCLVL